MQQLKKYEQLNFLAYRLTVIRKLTLNIFPKLSSECCTLNAKLFTLLLQFHHIIHTETSCRKPSDIYTILYTKKSSE